jgi:hypothetical protein
MNTMLVKITKAALALSLAVLVSACGGQPKQAEVADDTKETGVDMAGAESAPQNQPSEGAAAPEAAEMHAKCCELCKEGLSKDRTGADPKTIPCADFTDTLTPWCLEHFRGKPTMADACK